MTARDEGKEGSVSVSSSVAARAQFVVTERTSGLLQTRETERHAVLDTARSSLLQVRLTI
jgi:hypothetical protein